MAYEPTTWQCGDTITAEKLNKMEQGIAESGGGKEIVTLNIVHYTNDDFWAFLEPSADVINALYEKDVLLYVNFYKTTELGAPLGPALALNASANYAYEYDSIDDSRSVYIGASYINGTALGYADLQVDDGNISGGGGSLSLE